MEDALKAAMEKYGIDFSVMQNFKGAPAQGYISQQSGETYQIVLTTGSTHADSFWFSLFHEIGHIVNGDLKRAAKFVDYSSDSDREQAAKGKAFELQSI